MNPQVLPALQRALGMAVQIQPPTVQQQVVNHLQAQQAQAQAQAQQAQVAPQGQG